MVPVLFLWSLSCHALFENQSMAEHAETQKFFKDIICMLHDYVVDMEPQEPSAQNNQFDFREARPLEICQIGIGSEALDMLHFMLTAFAHSNFNVFDAQGQLSITDHEAWHRFIEPYTQRIILHDSYAAYNKSCDVIIWGVYSHLFALRKIAKLYTKDNGTEQGSVFVFDTKGCDSEDPQTIQDDTATDDEGNADVNWGIQYCTYLTSLWRNTICGSGHLPEEMAHCRWVGCACFVPATVLIDPTYDGNMNCEDFTGDFPEGDVIIKDRNSMEWTQPGEIYLGSGQWNQDWFIYFNFFRHYTEPGNYVDVGAMAPFVLSNTVAFEYCANWTGLCIEPNPYVQVPMQVYRSCRQLHICISGNPDHTSQRFTFNKDVSHTRAIKKVDGKKYQEGFFQNGTFVSRCFPLEAALAYAGGQRVDYLSVDVEGNEVDVFNDFPFQAFDIRVISVEVSHSSSHIIDVIFLTQGYVKVAVLGRDAIYVHQKHLQEMSKSPWPLRFPPKMRIFPHNEDYKTFQWRFRDPAFGGEG
eukprot:GEMP01031299.1.p1 GENE.GEMP01031299.1~~GEMP01031299.1.p1  ORF type:complete len:526 (+),score=101.73 GEMP01031299.1:180-1757(+)